MLTTSAPEEEAPGGIARAWSSFPTVPPLGDITWLNELPCTAPSFSPCHIPFVMLTTSESHNTELLLFLIFLRCTRGVPPCNSLPFIPEQRDVVFSVCASARVRVVDVCSACQRDLSPLSPSLPCAVQ